MNVVTDMEFATSGNRKFLIFNAYRDEQIKNALAGLVLAGGIDLYWVDIHRGKIVGNLYKVDKVSTIYGACPATFAIEVPN